MKVAIINTTFLNGGDAAINVGTMHILRRLWGDDTEFVCFDAQPDIARRLYPDIAIGRPAFDRVADGVVGGLPRKLVLLGLLAMARLARARPAWLRGRLLRRLREPLRGYAEADVVVSAGGTYLVDNYRMGPKIYEFLLVLALGRPLVLFTQSIGPLRGRRERLLLRWVLRRAALAMVRDDRSRRELGALGVPPDKVVQCPDAAFALTCAEGRGTYRAPGNPARIAVSVRDWPFFAAGDGAGMDGYLDAVAGFVRRVVEADCAEVTFLSSCQGVDDYWTDDSRIAEQTVGRLPPHVRANVRVDRSYRRPQELIDALKVFDCVVATRMHMAILALCAGRPVVPIAYEFKTRELFATLGLKVPVCDIETVSAGDLYAAWRSAGNAYGTGGLQDDPWQRIDAAARQALDSGRFVAQALAVSAVR